MPMLIDSKLSTNRFTFHYGSITIKYWNDEEMKYKEFTFHYGSITIARWSKELNL